MAVKKPGAIDERLAEVAQQLPNAYSVWKADNGNEAIVRGEVMGHAFKRAGYELIGGVYPIPHIGQVDPETGDRQYSDQDVTMLREIAAEQDRIDAKVNVPTAGIETEEIKQANAPRTRGGAAD